MHRTEQSNVVETIDEAIATVGGEEEWYWMFEDATAEFETQHSCSEVRLSANIAVKTPRSERTIEATGIKPEKTPKRKKTRKNKTKKTLKKKTKKTLKKKQTKWTTS